MEEEDDDDDVLEVGAELFHTDGRTKMTKLKVLSGTTNAHKTCN